MAGVNEDRVACRTPAKGRDGVTNIPTWKFNAVRSAVLHALDGRALPFAELREAVRARLSDDEVARLGSLGWHVTTVKLEMEVRSEILRTSENGRQVLARMS